MTQKGFGVHLPDLPEVPIGIGASDALPEEGASVLPPGSDDPPPRAGAERRQRARWPYRLRSFFGSMLPLLLMFALVAASWYMVQRSPGEAPGASAQRAADEPDYTMRGVVLERFLPDGAGQARLHGQKLRHYPPVPDGRPDRVEIDALTLSAVTPKGRPVYASAREGVAEAGGQTVQLRGAARVVGSGDGAQPPVVIESEFLQFQGRPGAQQISTDRAVVVTQGGSRVQAAGARYDPDTQIVDLVGPVRGVFPPQGAQP